MLNNIEAELARNGVSKQELSQKLNVSRQTISRWISKKASIPSDKLIELSKLLNCSVDYLLGIEIKPA